MKNRVLTKQSDRHLLLRCIMRICSIYSAFALHRLLVAVKQRSDYSRARDRDTDLIGESNKRSRLSLQMFSLDMMAPSITTPHVRGGGMRMTQLKSHCRGRIYQSDSPFHSATQGRSSPLLPAFSAASLCSRHPSSRLHSPSNFSCAFTIEMSSISSVEQGINAEVDWFNTAVRSPLRPVKMVYCKIYNLGSNDSVAVSFFLSSLIN